MKEWEVKKGKVIDKYTVTADMVPAKIEILDIYDEAIPLYKITVPKLDVATQALINRLSEDLTLVTPVDLESITDPAEFEKIKKEFFENARTAARKNLPNEPEDKISMLAGILLHRMFGLGFLDIIMSDNYIEEITINSSKYPLAIYHKKYGWCKTNEGMETEEDIYNLSSQIGRKIGREITNLNPTMDAHLLTGDRVASTLFPISTLGNTITIRRFARVPWTPINLMKPEHKTISPEVMAFLWQAIQYELNIIIAGGTASGKTSQLNALSSFMPPTQRIISIEDTREIQLPEDLKWNWVPLTSRNPNPEGKGEITMLDLMVESLRMRPDRIIVGEIRRKEQAETLFEAMHTGHSVYATMHADTALQVKRRLLEPPISIPKNEIESLQLIVIQHRDRRTGLRRTLEVAEVLQGYDELEINYLYQWRPRTDDFGKVNESQRVIDDLNLHTGMTAKEIKEDLKEKEKILRWMLDKDITDIDDFGKVMHRYYKDKNVILDAVKKNKELKDIGG